MNTVRFVKEKVFKLTNKKKSSDYDVLMGTPEAAPPPEPALRRSSFFLFGFRKSAINEQIGCHLRVNPLNLPLAPPEKLHQEECQKSVVFGKEMKFDVYTESDETLNDTKYDETRSSVVLNELIDACSEPEISGDSQTLQEDKKIANCGRIAQLVLNHYIEYDPEPAPCWLSSITVNEDPILDDVYIKAKRTDNKSVSIKLFHREMFREMCGDECDADHEFRAAMYSFSKGPLRKTPAGKSGCDMYWTHDRRYIMKSLSTLEAKHGKKLMPAYFEHKKTMPSSLLIDYIALFRVKKSGKSKYYCIMKNVFPKEFQPDFIFDMKGSTYGRRGRRGAATYLE